jgi:LacI family transcriptional regulator
MQDVLIACEKAGILIPDQLAAVGVDNDLITSECGIKPLTSVDDNRELLGFKAASLLEDLMNGATKPSEPVIIPPKGIVIRESSNILAVSHVKVAQALRFIWKNFNLGINSSTAARAVGLSRRGLSALFNKHLHHSVSDEILNSRLNEAKRLLIETDNKVDAIAALSGFKHGEHIARIFREKLGMKPSEYRTRNKHKEVSS